MCELWYIKVSKMLSLKFGNSTVNFATAEKHVVPTRNGRNTVLLWCNAAHHRGWKEDASAVVSHSLDSYSAAYRTELFLQLLDKGVGLWGC